MAPRTKYIQYRSTPGHFWNSFGTDYTDSYLANGAEELLVSEGHPYSKLGETNDDIGGNFFCIKRNYAESINPSRLYGDVYDYPPGNWYHYDGPQYARLATVSLLDYQLPPYSLPNVLAAYGTTAIARCIPTNPLAGLTVALGELRSEGIPTVVGAGLLKDRTRVARNAGSEYLNYQFGWLPLLSDIRSIADSVTNSKELEAEYVRNSGKRLKRRYSFPVEESVETVEVANSFAALPKPNLILSQYLSCDPRVNRTRTIRTERWFSGCFTYYLPPNDGLARSAAVANKLYGTRLTPETLWNLTPWTWAADWIGNFGDVVHNVSAFMSDGLVMPYGYIMEQSTITDQYISTGTRYKSYPGEDPWECSQTFTTVVKQRQRATPYGFGLDFADFTQRQWSILAALGLSRGGGKAGH